jgi:hypothetical protein
MDNYTQVSNGQRIMNINIPDPIISFSNAVGDDYEVQMYLFLANTTSFYQSLMLEMGYEFVKTTEDQKDISANKEYRYHSVVMSHPSLPKAEITTYFSFFIDSLEVDTVLTDILFDDVPRARYMIYTNSTHGDIKVNKVEHGHYIINSIRNHWASDVEPIKLMPASQLL